MRFVDSSVANSDAYSQGEFASVRFALPPHAANLVRLDRGIERDADQCRHFGVAWTATLLAPKVAKNNNAEFVSVPVVVRLRLLALSRFALPTNVLGWRKAASMNIKGANRVLTQDPQHRHRGW